MAREILFKAKRIDNGKWVEGYLYKIHDSTFIFPLITNGSYDVTRKVMKFMNPCFEVQPEAICQYTGLTDKNGKKIWENDVVFIDAYSYIEPEDEVMGVVAYSDTYACYGILGNKFVPISDCMGSYKTIYHAMGNIFDNPEFLEG